MIELDNSKTNVSKRPAYYFINYGQGFNWLYNAFSDSENLNKKNRIKAPLLFLAIIIGLTFLFFILFGALFASAMTGSGSYKRTKSQLYRLGFFLYILSF